MVISKNKHSLMVKKARYDKAIKALEKLSEDNEKISSLLLDKITEANVLATALTYIAKETGATRFVFPISLLDNSLGGTPAALAINSEDNGLNFSITITEESSTVQ